MYSVLLKLLTVRLQTTMRLINTETLELKTFFDSQVPDYAILSHTWGDEEVDLQAFSRGDGRRSAGWKKIDDCCKLARRDEYAWAWVDTCCIDKTSSAELSEAINSSRSLASYLRLA